MSEGTFRTIRNVLFLFQQSLRDKLNRHRRLCNAIGLAIGAMGASGFNAALNVATPNEMRSQINVLYFMLQNAIAGSLGPTLVALVTDYVAHSEADLRYVISGFRLVFGPLTAIFLWKALVPYGRVYRQRIEEGA